MKSIDLLLHDLDFDLNRMTIYLMRHKIIFSLKINCDEYGQEDVVLRVGNQEVLGLVNDYILRNVYYNIIN